MANEICTLVALLGSCGGGTLNGLSGLVDSVPMGDQ